MLEESLKNFNEGRSMNFYCKAYARMPIDLIDKALKETKAKVEAERMPASDLKSRAQILKSTIKDLAFKAAVELD